MPTYTPPLRDMQFVMHEVLKVTDDFKAMPRHAEGRRRGQGGPRVYLDLRTGSRDDGLPRAQRLGGRR